MEKEELLDKLNAIAEPVDLVAWRKRIDEHELKKETFLITDPYLEFRDNIYTDYANHPKPPQFKREAPKVHNNDPCTCGSGKKFKKCCKNK